MLTNDGHHPLTSANVKMGEIVPKHENSLIDGAHVFSAQVRWRCAVLM